MIIQPLTTYEFRVNKQNLRAILDNKRSSDLNQEYEHCKLKTLFHRLKSPRDWECLIIDYHNINTKKQIEILDAWHPKLIDNEFITSHNLSPDLLNKKYIAIHDSYLWPCSNESVPLIQPQGMSCSNCKEYSPWAEANVGNKFLCYSCKTNPITRAILGY